MNARNAWLTLADPARNSDWPAARLAYNESVARLFDQLRCKNGADWAARAAALGTRIALPDKRIADLSAFDSVFPAAGVNSRTVGERRVTEGIGVPAVGWKKTTPVTVPRKRFHLPSGLPYTLTITLSFDGPGPPEWRFIKRWLHEQETVGRSRHTMAADWSAANAFYWQMCELDDLTIQNVLLPERYMEENGLYFLQPYDPEKIPVVMVHGLKSSPDAFKYIINELAPEPWFRERYQVWLYNYPTGNPWLYSGIRFRELMNDASRYARSKGHDRNLNRMVILCHSMGGLITRSSVTDPGEKLYDAHFEAKFENLKASPDSRDLIRRGLLYQPLTEPKRVVFMAVPHRGSPIANLRASLLLQNLIKLPKRLTIDLLDATLHSGSGMPEEHAGKVRPPTSISSLSPKSRGIVGLNKLPLPKHITFHSIIGQRGSGDLANSSDGVVPYWSSSVSPVASEKVVPFHHGVPDYPEAIEEVKRILRLHIDE
jgi:hypothetical protein